MSAPVFNALLLAGGRSSRMGVEKATLLVEGLPLWRRQLNVLREAGATSLAVAGPLKGPYASQATVLEDERPGLGPLSGIISGLLWSRAPLLLVLAVDLPRMSAAFLRELTAAARPGEGIVPRSGEWFEPLAAVYPREALPLAQQLLDGDDRSLQRFVHACESAGRIRARALTPEELPLFTNVNTPEDWRGQQGGTGFQPVSP